MAIGVSQICSLARMRLGDSGRTKYSDYEMVSACQAALDLVQMKIEYYYSPALTAVANIAVSGGRGPLPADFGAVLTVRDGRGREFESNYDSSLGVYEYRIADGALETYSGASETLTLTYRKRLARLSESAEDALAQTVDLPVDFMLPLGRMTADLIGGDFATADSLAGDAAKMNKLEWLSNARDYSLFGGYRPILR